MVNENYTHNTFFALYIKYLPLKAIHVILAFILYLDRNGCYKKLSIISRKSQKKSKCTFKNLDLSRSSAVKVYK
jgi:hypothetical protein